MGRAAGEALRSGGTQAVLEALLAGTGHAPLTAPAGALHRGGDLGPATTPGTAVQGGGAWGGTPDFGGQPVTAGLDPEDEGALDWMLEEQAREMTPADVTLPRLSSRASTATAPSRTPRGPSTPPPSPR